MSYKQLPIEEVKRQSPDTDIGHPGKTTSFDNTVTTTEDMRSSYWYSIQKCKRRRRTLRFASQFKLIIILLSLLEIGDNFLPTGLGYCTSKGLLHPMFGTVFVDGATILVDDSTNEEKKRRTSQMRAHAAPEVPLSRKIKKETSKSFRGKFKFGFGQQVQEVEPEKQVTFSEILKKAGKSGIGGGIPGAIAGAVQVLSLMWLRTVMNYQCRYGSTFFQAVTALNSQGGIPRFYRGLSFALFQAPLARFVSTAANDGVETLLANLKMTEDWGPGRSTVIASIVVGMWRMFLMPIDTCKTVLQIDSVDGFRNLMRKVKAGKVHVLYQGAVANAVSAIASHYPWFYTFRVLSHNTVLQKIVRSNHLRNALIGFVSSVVSDTFANSIRVVKTAKQAMGSTRTVGYGEVVAMIVAVDGLKGLFGRGLRTRILGNALQSVIFTVIWRGLAERNKTTSNDDRQSSRPTAIPDNSEVVEEIEESNVPLEEERF
mmetsp:Transcript_5752/g.7351  ORF Transcript_5752/g.7351 Transcript_5752/m.7351 type:complete len:485 (-) Transcript_5752:80-1534(-)